MNESLTEKLILKRLDRVYCKLAPSKIHGVGVFAIRDIPEGINPFKDSYQAQESILIDTHKIKETCHKELLVGFHPSNESEKKQIVSNYPNQLIWSNYINYSDMPNLELSDNGEWETLRPIKKGEELVENPLHFFKEDGSRKVFTVRPNQYPLLR